MGLRFDVVRAGGLGAAMVIAGCGSYASDGGYPGGGGTRAYGEDGASTGVPSTGTGSAPSSSSGGTGTTGSGRLTAGSWDDNVNYELFTSYRDGAATQLPFTPEEQDGAHDLFGAQRTGRARLDVALVIDTTGSMGDELSYLQTELDAIATRVVAAYPAAETRWALVVYKDEGDEYVTRAYDFESVDEMRAQLAAEHASGGGDYPEASHAALRDMSNLGWREGASVARLGFWIADAPHHVEHESEWAEALRTAAQLDVHVYPIASSGVDEPTELEMRSAAQLTGGRYLFLTDDSGIGGAHLEPSIPCYYVTHLDDAMLRAIDAEMTGEPMLPSAEQIVRTAGDPDDAGICTLESGATARAF